MIDAPVPKAIARETLVAIVLDRVSTGDTYEQISDDTHYSVEYLRKLVKECAALARERNADRVDEAFHKHDLALDYLYRVCAQRIKAAASADPPVFDKEAVKCAIMVLDRQSKLLGLDKARGPTGANLYDWMKDASEGELRRMAERFGLKLPEPFAMPS